MLWVLHARARGRFERFPCFALALCDTCHARSLLQRHVSRLLARCVASRMRCPLCAAHCHTRRPYAHVSRACAPVASHPCSGVCRCAVCFMPPQTLCFRAAPALRGTSRSSVCRRFLLHACLRACTAAHVRPAPLHGARPLQSVPYAFHRPCADMSWPLRACCVASMRCPVCSSTNVNRDSSTHSEQGSTLDGGQARPQTASEARPLFARKARPPQRANLVHSRQARLDHALF